jgi:hypothetical protein
MQIFKNIYLLLTRMALAVMQKVAKGNTKWTQQNQYGSSKCDYFVYVYMYSNVREVWQ